ncbi:3444_t:CDS:2 [Funneliformis mosseae]|uniref:3444_t:CDS:1 n=1 Tax=Funneliformis mosseae TaxID=27381 RepID=A0A9N9E149_FUNMO|nr:3444_t:CDS:2 [Funneliformis mosseae]
MSSYEIVWKQVLANKMGKKVKFSFPKTFSQHFVFVLAYLMSHVPEQDNREAYFSRPLKSYTKKAEEYQACLITIIYGETYLDPGKVKVRSFDLIKAIEVGHEIIDCPGSALIGFRTLFKEFIDQAKKGNKNNKKLSKKLHNLWAKLEDKLYSKVVAVKTNDDELYSERFGL